MNTVPMETSLTENLDTLKFEDEPPSKPLKKYDIWSRMAQEESMQEMTTQLGQIQMTSSNLVKIERGPESFFIEKGAFSKSHQKSKNRSTHKRSKGKKYQATATPSDDMLEEGELSDSAESDSSISSGGLSDDDILLLRRRTMPHGQTNKKRTRGKQERKQFHELTYNSEETFDDVIKNMKLQLQEQNESLLRDVVTAVGIPAATKILNKTLKIERTGGLMVKDNTRRRTPGGTFFYVIQRHPGTKSHTISRLLTAKKSPKKRKRGENVPISPIPSSLKKSKLDMKLVTTKFNYL